MGVLELWIPEVLERWDLHLGGILELAGIRGGAGSCGREQTSQTLAFLAVTATRVGSSGRRLRPRGDYKRLGRQPGDGARSKEHFQEFRHVPPPQINGNLYLFSLVFFFQRKKKKKYPWSSVCPRQVLRLGRCL